MCIEQRPKFVGECTRLGSLADLMIGRAHKSALLVITDRAKLFNRLKKITSRYVGHTERAIEQGLPRIPIAFITTLTVNNDKAFANH